MEQYSSVEEFAKGFELLGLKNDDHNTIAETITKYGNGKVALIEVDELTKTPNNKPKMGSMVYGKLERPSR